MLQQDGSRPNNFNLLNQRTHHTELLLHSQSINRRPYENGGLGGMSMDCKEDSGKADGLGGSGRGLEGDFDHRACMYADRRVLVE